MPYRFQNQKIKLPRQYDRRVKLSEGEKEEIRQLYAAGWPVRKIARRFADQCSRRLIQFILFPDRLAVVRADFKRRRKDGRYYDKEKNTEAMREHRRYKQQLAKAGLLEAANSEMEKAKETMVAK